MFDQPSMKEGYRNPKLSIKGLIYENNQCVKKTYALIRKCQYTIPTIGFDL